MVTGVGGGISGRSWGKEWEHECDQDTFYKLLKEN